MTKLAVSSFVVFFAQGFFRSRTGIAEKVAFVAPLPSVKSDFIANEV